VHEKLRHIAEVRSVVQRELTSLTTDGIADLPAVQGAFYFLLRLRPDRIASPALEVAERLIREHSVAVIPGDAFGLERPSHLRVAYGALQKETAAEGIGRLVRGLRALAKSRAS
jgi:aspartate/methionine/tyrosine aminotransferase